MTDKYNNIPETLKNLNQRICYGLVHDNEKVKSIRHQKIHTMDIMLAAITKKAGATITQQ